MFKRRKVSKTDAIFKQKKEDYIPCIDGIKHQPTIATKDGIPPINVAEDVSTNKLKMNTTIACYKCKKLMPLDFSVKLPSYWDLKKLEDKKE